MANLTAYTSFANLQKVWSMPYSFRIANAVRIFAGALCGLPGANALTSSRGYLQRWQNQLNLQWAGLAEAQSWTGGLIVSAQTGTAANVNSVLGDTSLTPVPEITVETGPFIGREIVVTGVSAQTDVWRTLIYLSTDNFADLTTTATPYAPAVGKVVYWNTSTTCSVYFFGMLRSTSIS